MSTGRNMSTEQNKAVIQRWNDVVLNEKRVDRADELVTQDYVDRAALPGQAPGPGSLPPFTNARQQKSPKASGKPAAASSAA